MSLVLDKLSELTKTLSAFIYRDAVPLRWQICDNLPYGTTLPNSGERNWRALLPGELWGSRLSWAWLITDITIPDGFANRPAALHIQLDPLLTDPDGYLLTGPEALVTVAGIETPVQTINTIHHEILLAEHAAAGSPLKITLECFTGVSQPGDHRVRFKMADLVWIDRDVEALYWDAQTLLDTIKALPTAAPERAFYLTVLDEVFRSLNWINPPDDAFRASVRKARTVLQERVFRVQALHETAAPRPIIHAVGHAHIDVAWLWPLKVTRGKAARTFATALAFMDQFPEYTFTQSQPHLYKMVSQDRPDLFERIKTRAAEGRWNATGATWVEMDTNVPSGESLVRQFLYGMRFFQRELGVRPEVLWLPDVFGYSAALPQLMKLAGIRYFFTAKLSWNQFTHMPYDTFWWEGLDGSRVLTHLSTTPDAWGKRIGLEMATYNGNLIPQEILETWTTYQQKEDNHHLLAAYGMGDGGGGPNRDMIERRARLDDLAGMPQVKHSTAEKFFHALEETIPADLPAWVGELYFQLHRGTYTSQARTKRHNRKLEVLLHHAEAMASITHLLGAAYPHESLCAAWETVLLNQFHDILPGSSINAVYQDAARDYAQAQLRAAGALEESLAMIAQHIRYDVDMKGFAVFNTLGSTLSGPVEVTLPGDGPVEIVGPSGRRKPFQWIDASARRALLLPNSVPAYGHKAYAVRPVEQETVIQVENAVTGTPLRLENNLLRAEFDQQGHLVRLYDLENFRDVLSPDQIGNQLWAYVDRPHEWDAWEVESYVQDQGWMLHPESVLLVEEGPLRATLQMTYVFNRSRIVQRVSLLAGQRALTFDTDVDWHERHILLRTHFPLLIRANHVTYEIQFGTIERPTHRNTPWDQAQFEVPAQQWADMSEAGYGVSLLNDCKYGYSAQANILSLSLLRSPTNPDPEADQGPHTFTYALYPHSGDWRQGTIGQARRLNYPLLVQSVPGSGTWLPVEFGLVSCRTPGVMVDTIKKAEDSDSLIVRVYEAHGGRTTATLAFVTRILSAEEVNLLEEPAGPADVKADTLRFTLAPYQIRTFHVKLADILAHQLG
jgi:alpha-mannosidase